MSVDSSYLEVVVFQCFDDLLDVVVPVCFHGHFESHLVGIAVDGLELVVFQLDDVGSELRQDLGDLTSWPGLSAAPLKST
jgi:hypothetical protein